MNEPAELPAPTLEELIEQLEELAARAQAAGERFLAASAIVAARVLREGARLEPSRASGRRASSS